MEKFFRLIGTKRTVMKFHIGIRKKGDGESRLDRFYFFLTGEAWSIPIVSRIHRARTRNGVKIVETDFHADTGEIHGKAGSLVLEAVRYGNGRDAVRIHV